MSGNRAKRKNVVFILTDDQGAWAMGCAGNSEIKTPNLDRLAKDGIRFDNFFCASPVCSPARASIMTGNIPSGHGVVDWIAGGNIDPVKYPELVDKAAYSAERVPINYLENQLTYTDILAQNGYTCALSGKWHLGNSAEPQHGFSEWFTVPYGYSPYLRPKFIENGEVIVGDKYATDMITNKAIEYIKKLAPDARQGDKPFYISVHHVAPHSPWSISSHPQEVLDVYKDSEFGSVPNLPMHPNSILTSESPYISFDPNSETDPELLRKEMLRGYFGSITAMDEGIGHLIMELEAQGILDDTLVIFTSDNGMNMGHHGIWGKGNGTYPQNMYDTSVKVPYIMSCPGLLPTERVSDQILSQYDIFPTLVDLLGLQLTDEQRLALNKLPGTSFRPRTEKNEESSEDRPVIVFSEYGPVRMIRNKRWKYIHCYPHGPNEFYDLEKDPLESTNLADHQDHQDRILRMKWELDSWFVKYVDPARDATKDDNTGTGQINLNGLYSEGEKAFIQSPFVGVPYDEVIGTLRKQNNAMQEKKE
ncbi:sulfatase-like hydrolase/transferase [Paenibacillus sanguinis]|uniref:sulfatase-like hydrolase/transferase n=1 Tax=Paenibacillus sanguinis TaxID=225906 RepID=UPI001F0B1639|nr:sulfatase-like hydrolase/transferase [Paenibacillus sanguinis]